MKKDLMACKIDLGFNHAKDTLLFPWQCRNVFWVDWPSFSESSPYKPSNKNERNVQSKNFWSIINTLIFNFRDETVGWFINNSLLSNDKIFSNCFQKLLTSIQGWATNVAKWYSYSCSREQTVESCQGFSSFAVFTFSLPQQSPCRFKR